jgi:integrase
VTLRFTRLNRASIQQLGSKRDSEGKRYFEPAKLIEHGIAAERLVDGDLRYSINIMVDGRRVHRVIGRESEGVTRTQAEEFIEQTRTHAKEGRLNLPKGRKITITFAKAADDYIERLEQSGGANLVAKRRHLRMYLKPHFGAMRLDGISSFAIERYKKLRRDEAAAPATINRELATLSHFLSMATKWQWLDRLSARPEMLKESAGRIIALDDEQCDALMTASIGSADPYLWLFVAFGLNTAMRHSEIMATRWDRLDLSRRRLFIPEAKAGQREQPITPELAELLAHERKMRDDRKGWIFPSPHSDSAAGHRARMGRPFRDAVSAAGLDPEVITPHVMRHTAITKLVQAGVDLPTIQRISGHRTMTMVLRYTHVHGSHIDQAIKAIGRTIPQQPANGAASAITPKLHTQPRRHSRIERAAKPKLKAG